MIQPIPSLKECKIFCVRVAWYTRYFVSHLLRHMGAMSANLALIPNNEQGTQFSFLLFKRIKINLKNYLYGFYFIKTLLMRIYK